MANPGHSAKQPRTGAARKEVVIMRLMLDTSAVTFTVTKAAEPRKDFGKDVAEGGPRHRPPAVGGRGARPWTPSAGR